MIKFMRQLSIAMLLMAVFCPCVYAASGTPSSSPVVVNGTRVSIEAYNISGSNYFKLRDLAMILSGTAKPFEVGYDESTKAITVKSGTKYTPTGGELATGDGKAKNAAPTASRIFVDGKELSITVYNIDGSNYFKLRDIGEALNVGVDYDAQSNSIVIDTSAGYTAPATVAAPPAVSAAPSSAIITETAKIGGSTAQLVYIQMGGSRKGTVVTANGNVASDQNQAELVKRAPGKLVAAINGGFFASYYDAGKPISFPDNYPGIYGAVMQNGRVINATGQTNALAFDKDGKPHIDRVDIKTSVVVKKAKNDAKFTAWGVNKYFSDAGAVSLFTPELTLPFTVNGDSKVVSIKDGRVVSVAGGGSYTVPAGTTLLVFNSAAAANAEQWENFPAAGDSAETVYEFSPRKGANAPDWAKMTAIAAGGRMLLQNGYAVTNDKSYNESFDADPKQAASAVAQRSFAAIMSDGRLVLGTCSASFDAIAEYLKSKNAIDAVSLDGGASSMLYADGKGFLTNAGRKLASAVVIVED